LETTKFPQEIHFSRYNISKAQENFSSPCGKHAESQHGFVTTMQSAENNGPLFHFATKCMTIQKVTKVVELVMQVVFTEVGPGLTIMSGKEGMILLESVENVSLETHRTKHYSIVRFFFQPRQINASSDQPFAKILPPTRSISYSKVNL
jgi:hypothetical protein